MPATSRRHRHNSGARSGSRSGARSGSRSGARSLGRRVVSIAMWSLCALLCACTIAGAYGGMIAPGTSLLRRLAPLAVMAFPYVAMALLVAAVAAALLRSRAWWLAVATAAACAPSLFNVMPVRFLTPSAGPADRSFTLLTFNVMNCLDNVDTRRDDASAEGNRVLDYIIASGADVVCLQELYGLPRPGVKGTTEQQLARLAEIYPYHGAWGMGSFTILSKYPMRTISRGKPAPYGYSYYCGVAMDIDGLEVAIINTHLQSIGLSGEDRESYEKITRGDADRADVSDVRHSVLRKLNSAFIHHAEQAREIAAWADSLAPMPMIVCGDFNDVPLSYPLRTLRRAGLHEVYPRVGLGPRITYHENRFYFRIDHLFWRGPFEPVELKIGSTRVSDHYPVMVKFLLHDTPSPAENQP